MNRHGCAKQFCSHKKKRHVKKSQRYTPKWRGQKSNTKGTLLIQKRQLLPKLVFVLSVYFRCRDGVRFCIICVLSLSAGILFVSSVYFGAYLFCTCSKTHENQFCLSSVLSAPRNFVPDSRIHFRKRKMYPLFCPSVFWSENGRLVECIRCFDFGLLWTGRGVGGGETP